MRYAITGVVEATGQRQVIEVELDSEAEAEAYGALEGMKVESIAVLPELPAAHTPQPTAPGITPRTPEPTAVAAPPVAPTRDCPKCGCPVFKKVKPRTVVAFGSDRKCVMCETRYVPPTPIWAGVVFAGLALLFGVVSLVAVPLALVALFQGAVTVRPGVFIAVLLPVITLGCVLQARNSFSKSRRVTRYYQKCKSCGKSW
jgi:hypothetical protein